MLYGVSSDGKTQAYVVWKGAGNIATELVDFRTKKVLQTVSGYVEFFVENGKVGWRSIISPFNLPTTPKIVLDECNLTNLVGSNFYRLLMSNGKKAILTVSSSDNIKSLELWDIATCKVENTISFPSANLVGSIFSPNGRWLATSDRYTARVWSLETKKIRFSVPGKMFYDQKDLIQFNADGTRFLTSSRYDGSADPQYTISSFDTQTGKLVREIKSTGEMRGNLVATPNKDIILAFDSNGFHFWNIETGQLLSSIPNGPYAFDRNSGQIWVALEKEQGLHQVVLFDYQTGSKIRELEPIHTPLVHELFVTETQKLMLLTSLAQGDEKHKMVSIIDLQSGALSDLSKSAPQYNYLTAAQNIFATYDMSGYSSLWNFERNTPYFVLLGNHINTTVNDSDSTSGSLFFSDSVKFLNENVLVANGETIRFWDTKTGRLISEIKPDYAISDITFSPNQQLMAVTGVDGIVRLWGVPKP